MGNKPKLKVIINKTYKDKVYTPEEQFRALYNRSINDFVVALFENRNGEFDDCFDQTEDFKISQKRKRARERRAAGGW